MRNILRKHLFTLAMIIGAVVSIAIAGFSSFAAECERIPKGVLRLHILAESNSKADQEFKLQMRDYVLENYSHEFAECDSLQSATAKAEELLPQIERDLDVFADTKAEVTEMYFPTRVYGNTTYPAGNYTALRITIGEGKGDNWWCVMFPTLCVSAISDRESVDAIAVPDPAESPKVKFALFEFLSKFFKHSNSTKH